MIEHKDIHEAVIAIMHEIGYVQKQKSPNLNYSYAGEAALIAALRPVMIEHGVYCYVSRIVPSREAFTTAKGTFMNVTVSQGEVTFVHSKNGTSITVQAIGEGMDVGDKSANKSATGLLKYALRQTFLIETGDDPDSHDNKQMERAKASKANPDPIDDKAWHAWLALCHRAEKVDVTYANVDREKTTKSDLRDGYRELEAFVKNAEAQAKAVQP